jgi:hypothetical protein
VSLEQSGIFSTITDLSIFPGDILLRRLEGQLILIVMISLALIGAIGAAWGLRGLLVATGLCYIAFPVVTALEGERGSYRLSIWQRLASIAAGAIMCAGSIMQSYEATLLASFGTFLFIWIVMHSRRPL